MTKWIYTGNGAYIQDLPAQDLDDSALSDRQKELLKIGVTAKLYKAEDAPKPKSVSNESETQNRTKKDAGTKENG